MGSLPDNLHIIDDMNDVHELYRGRKIHVTNGVYSAKPELIVPTTLAGFKYISDQTVICKKYDVFVIAVNSDQSFLRLMFAKNASDEEFAAMEDQRTRAMKVALPLAQMVGNRDVAVVFFNEETPAELFHRFTEQGLEQVSLHKWGYGTEPDAPMIVGADRFQQVYGFPLPNDIKPFAHDMTHREKQPSVKVVRLTEYDEDRGNGPYLSTNNKVLFPVENPALQQYAANIRYERFITTTSAGLSIQNPPKPGQP